MSRKKTLRETLESLEEEKVEEQRRQKYDNASFADETLGGAFGKPQDRGRFGDLSRGGRPRGKDRGWAAEPEQKRQTSGLPVSRNIREGKPLGKRARNQKIKKYVPARRLFRRGGGFASYVRIKGRMVYCDFSIDTTVTIGKSTIAALAHYATNRTAVTSSAITPVTATMIGKSIPCPRWTTIIARIRHSRAVFDRLPPTGMCGAEPAGVVANPIRTDEKPGQGDRRAVERQATTQLTTLTSLLAGFGFLWFTSLVDKELLTPFSLVVLVVTALTISVLVLASIVGALLTIASEIAIREGPLHRAEALWVVATKSGILLFLTSIGLLPYRVSFVGGVICSILAAGTAITVFVAWDWIQRFSRPGGGRGGAI